MTPDIASTQTRLPLEAIRRSPTNPRKRFPEAEHLELTASVVRHDVLQPILVRPWPDEPGIFELVAGERRHRAAEAAGKADIPVLVRDLTDDEVLHIQIIENLQRKDVHPLEEADGYQQLVARGHTIEQIADEVSQTRTYVAQRLKLTSLSELGRKAFFDAKLTAGTALIIARLPAELQKDALSEILRENWHNAEPMSAKAASEHVQHRYMLRLDQAPFKTSDAELVPAAGACGPCPKRTGNQVDLFGDVKSKEICTDPSCYEGKRAAAAAQKMADAEASGRIVIAGKEAKTVAPQSYGSLKGGWIDLDSHCVDDPKYRTYRQIIGAKAAKQAAVLEDPHSDKLRDVMQQTDVKRLLADKGIEASRSSSPDSREAAKKKAEDAYRGRLFAAVRDAYATSGLDGLDLKIVALAFYKRLWSENQRRLAKLREWGTAAVKEADFARKLDELEANDPMAISLLLMDIALIDESVVATYSNGKPDLLEAIASHRGIDPAALRKQVEAERKEAVKSKAKPATKKASKPVSKRKPRVGAEVAIEEPPSEAIDGDEE